MSEYPIGSCASNPFIVHNLPELPDGYTVWVSPNWYKAIVPLGCGIGTVILTYPRSHRVYNKLVALGARHLWQGEVEIFNTQENINKARALGARVKRGQEITAYYKLEE